ncbi:hypothetical protein [Leeia oryzae]|uniref:hypothetical protein n=1 Tax=Leeia oryzae TaxID=356662 RepID=UPI0003654CD0|nr:hypothetical protein [Leeia oryzae]
MSLPPDTGFPLDEDEDESPVLSKMEALLKRHRPGDLAAPVLTEEAQSTGMSDYPVLMDPDMPSVADTLSGDAWFDPDGPILDLDNIPTDDLPLQLDIDVIPTIAPAPVLRDDFEAAPPLETPGAEPSPEPAPLPEPLAEDLAQPEVVPDTPEAIPVAETAIVDATASDIVPASEAPLPTVEPAHEDIPTLPVLQQGPAHHAEEDVPVLTELALEYDEQHLPLLDNETRAAWVAEMVEEVIRELTPRITGLVRAQLGLQIGALMKTVTEHATTQLQAHWRQELQQKIEQRVVDEIDSTLRHPLQGQHDTKPAE